MTNLQKRLFIICFSIHCPTYVFADNWYALNSYKSEHDNYLTLMTITNDKDTCEKIIKIKSQDIEEKWEFQECECFSGKSYDEMYSNILNDQPLPEPYIKFIDNNGYKTILKFIDIFPPLENTMISAPSKAL